MYRKIKNVMLLLLISGSAFAQRRVGNASDIANKINQATAPVDNIFQTIRYWLYGGFGLAVTVRLLMILFDSGRGEDKIMKLGNLLVVIVIGAIIILIAESVFS